MKKFIIFLILLTIVTDFVYGQNPASHNKSGLIFEDPKNINWLEKRVIEIKDTIPDSIDHSEHIPPVGNQSNNDCTAWATGYYYKTYQEWEEHNWNVDETPHQFSPTFIYNQINGGADYGSRFSDAFKLLSDLGCANLVDCPYNPSNYTSWPSEVAYEGAIPFRCEDWYYFSCEDSNGVQTLKQHLANGKVAVIGIWAGWSNFYNISNYNNIYCVSDTVPGGGGLGHAVTVVGYNDNLETSDGVGAFRLVNSWGTGWGDNGFFWMSYEAIKHPELSYQDVYYSIDKIDYLPDLILKFKIDHQKRKTLELNAGIGSNNSPFWSKQFFNWIAPEYEPQSFPDNNIVLDISEGSSYIDTSGTNVFLSCLDTEDDGTNGTVEYFYSDHLEWGFGSISNEIPKNIPDSDETIYVNLTIPRPELVIDPDTIVIDSTEIVDFSVTNQMGSPLPGVEIAISGFGLPNTLSDTTDTNGECQIAVDSPYGQILDVSVKDISNNEILFEDSLFVSGGVDLSNPEITASVNDLGDYEELALDWETLITGSTNNNGFMLYAKGATVDTCNSFSSNSGSINIDPQELGEVKIALAKTGYNIYTKYFPINSALYVSGSWEQQNSPYLMEGNLRIQSDQTLDINPGVKVKFADNYALFVNGLLIAIGTENDSIYFVSDTSNLSGWQGISFINSNSSSELKYCCIKNSNNSGVFCENSDITISNNLIKNNSSNKGGGIHCDNSNSIIKNNIIIDNSASDGGGIYYYLSYLVIDGNLICNNSSSMGGGLFNYNSEPTIKNNTIVNNHANTYGGGIFEVGAWRYYQIYNSIIYFNTADNGTQIYSTSSMFPTISYCNIQDKDGEGVIAQDATWGDGNIDSNPLFVDTTNRDYHLTENSPCIDAGDPSLPLDPDGTIADMGAFYYDQSGTIYPPESDFVANIQNGYSPLVVRFADLSIQGTGAINEWEWNFGDGTDTTYTTSLDTIQHTYQDSGFYSVSLTVSDENDSTDTETKIDYITVFGNDEPASPTDVQVNIVDPDAIVSWSAVDTTIFGDPIDIDAYLVYYCGSPDSVYYFHGLTTNTTYTHQYVAQFSDEMFYQVTAYVGDMPTLRSIIAKYENIEMGELERLIMRERKYSDDF